MLAKIVVSSNNKYWHTMKNNTHQPKTIGEVMNDHFAPSLKNAGTVLGPELAALKPMNIEELSIFLSKPVDSIYQFTSKKKIPHVKCGRDLLFFPDEIISWLKSNSVKTKDQLKQEVIENLLKS